ncbi:hypothetical protein CLOSBL3_20214 [Clostridiaceae bacterium BL-3]|nr:hypothetical protein CLOSBL3_20214 [Clostridiaceae bacterium BL-3]
MTDLGMEFVANMPNMKIPIMHISDMSRLNAMAIIIMKIKII